MGPWGIKVLSISEIEDMGMRILGSHCSDERVSLAFLRSLGDAAALIRATVRCGMKDWVSR